MKFLCTLLGRTYRFLRCLISHPYSVAFILLTFLLALPLCFKIGINNSLYVIGALTAGWLVAFHTNYWNYKNSFLNQLKFSAAKAMIEKASDASYAVVALDGNLRNLTSRFNLRRGPTGEYFSQWGDIKVEIESSYQRYNQSHLDLLRLFEENEILFLDFKRRMNVFSGQWSLISSSYYKFHDTLQVLTLVHLTVPKEDHHTAKIRQEMKYLSSRSLDLMGLYYDLRVDLLNATLGKLMHQRVPNRAPKDPAVKLLSRLAEDEAPFDP